MQHPKTWNSLELKQGSLVLKVSPEVGGRITSLTFNDEQLLFTLPEARGITLDTTAIANPVEYKRGRSFPITGGDKLWLAPQDRWKHGLPPLDLDSGAYTVTQHTEHKIELVSPLCRETQMRVHRKIELTSACSVLIEDSIENGAPFAQDWNPWNVTQILRPWKIYLPCTPDTLRPYDFAQSSTLFAERCRISPVGSCIDVTTGGEFKFGGVLPIGEIVAVKDQSGLRWRRTFEAVTCTDAYSHQSSFEVYNYGGDENPYFEIEIHAPTRTLQSHEKNTLAQTWAFDFIE